MVALPAYYGGNALNFEPVTNALAQVTAQNNSNRQYGLEQQQSARADQSLDLQKQTTASQLKSNALEQEKAYAQLTGGWAQTALGTNDPATIQKTWEGIKSSHPEFVTNLHAHGIDPNDAAGGLKFITAEAQGYQNPLDVQAKQAQIQALQGENAIRGKSWGITGQNLYGQPIYGLVDVSKPNGGIQQAGAQPGLTTAADAGSIPPGQGATGEDYLKTLPKPIADQVKALAEGRLQIPSGFALKTPYWQQMLTHVSQYDPSFDGVNYNSRAATRKDFTSGKSAQNITSFNTAIGHLGTLYDAIDKLGNSDIPAVNSATNATVSVGNADRAAKLSSFNAAKDAVSKEMVKAFRGSGGSLTEIQGFENLFDAAQSPAALKAAVKQAVELLNSRVEAVGEQYNKGMGTTSDPMTLLSPKALATLKKIYPDAADAPAQPALSSAPRPTIPQPGEVRNGYRFKGGNPGDQNSWEAVQ